MDDDNDAFDYLESQVLCDIYGYLWKCQSILFAFANAKGSKIKIKLLSFEVGS